MAVSEWFEVIFEWFKFILQNWFVLETTRDSWLEITNSREVIFVIFLAKELFTLQLALGIFRFGENLLVRPIFFEYINRLTLIVRFKKVKQKIVTATRGVLLSLLLVMQTGNLIILFISSVIPMPVIHTLVIGVYVTEYLSERNYWRLMRHQGYWALFIGSVLKEVLAVYTGVFNSIQF